jgi:hypothetical protein
MANSTDQNEYIVQLNADIQKDLEKYNIDLAATLFEARDIEKIMEDDESTGSSDDATSTSSKKSFVDFGDGKANNIMVMQANAMNIQANELTEEKKVNIKKKAKHSKEVKESKADEDRTK